MIGTSHCRSINHCVKLTYQYDSFVTGHGGKVVKLRLTAKAAQKRLRELAQSSSNIRWSQHIRERMVERGIDTDAVLRVLREGTVDAAPIETNVPGDWKFKVTRDMPSGRTAGVVTVLIQDQALRLVTAEWEDLR